ncbi:DHS-like NAD/FAD-binding domain-containing protein [Ascobolus immersus RN42]|uniref:DHS-like NAD/FAD-binding domain-containing protein n=1 Tax=Ascobolus immersus RN42 TaxID=1160509 RepID=A0A3N4HV02_ASCIM|nr:DHS-like NAD/FAD-binding domain-containing protein [Ascobolus immersus RN42]
MATPSPIPPALLTSFHSYLLTPNLRILVVIGAGLSAASGLATFRGAGGHWRNFDAMTIATPEAFNADPGFVWQFYQMRRRAAFAAKPNPAHYALAEAAKRCRDFLAASQNVDGLSRRAGHPEDKIEYIHGNLSTLSCFQGMDYGGFVESCGWKAEDQTQDLPIPDEGVVPREMIPKCPNCKTGLQRPGVVWFGESLDEKVMDRIQDWLEVQGPSLCLVVGTSGRVYPAAAYAKAVKKRGGKVAVVDIEDRGAEEGADWSFVGDAAVVVPEILKPLMERPEVVA